jgi:hypothetical protein
LQSQVALSTAKAEYMIPLMDLIKEMREHKFNIINTQPHIYCNYFENNSGALELE